LPARRSEFNVVAGADGRIYVLGGYDEQSIPTTAVDVYLPGSKLWVSGPRLTTERYYFASTAGPAGRIYVFGGYFDSTSAEVLPTTAVIANAALHASGRTVQTSVGVPFNGLVASFTDDNPFATATDFSATINWGDGNSSAGAVAADPSGGYEVRGVHTYASAGSKSIVVTIRDQGGSIATAESTAIVSTFASVSGEYLFYNNSLFDGHNPLAGSTDDSAIAIDKLALRPGQTGSFVNYSSYSRGINGVMVDIAGRPSQPLTSDDFEFRLGNDNAPAQWPLLTVSPAITTRLGAGANSSERITLTWPDQAISKTWLQVTVKQTASTGLSQPYVFYFGNAVGETGDNSANAYINATDEISARNNPKTFVSPATITDRHDFNRDGFVNAADQILARISATVLTSLQLIAAPSSFSAALAPSTMLPLDQSAAIAAGLSHPKNARSIAGPIPLESLFESNTRENSAFLHGLEADSCQPLLDHPAAVDHSSIAPQAWDCDEDLLDLIAEDFLATARRQK
jgi:hypothetical protein